MGKNKKKSLRYYYGINHAHTAFSTGKGTPLEAYKYGMNNGLNFLTITDHNSYLNKEVYINSKQVSRWFASNYAQDKFSKKSDNFIPLIGFETRTSLYGDFNIINSNTFFTGVVKDLNVLALWMINNPDAIITINHPHKNILSLNYNEIFNKIITSIEVGNGSFPNKYTRYEKYYYALLDKGWKLGAINGQDNHRMNFGDSENLTAILTSDLTNEKIINAFRKRQTYSTESRTLKMYFTINDILMGDIIEQNIQKLKFMIYAEDFKVKINQIDIITNKGIIIKKIDSINLNSIKYLYEHERQPGESWYLVKIYQDNNRIAISSPIFITKFIR
ncbi:CehA/McbA family metallohydrolase [Clostridium sp. SHJSY1]|uniref:CehA/McbA family metallohydrolase n=1 Tax=Clostridium sp. SHJSY1 TaxID=2942483 RepID=UPI0028755BF4|nr:CehA/McbA family metallohydrolase [Clostridium sp. SHJSY1]MDS0524511.1 CehA/McbA family metallohydrolase [Clostridium sp. SHJSY1]